MKTLKRLEITLTLLGPILTRGGGKTGTPGVDPGLDAVVARAPDGRPMLPYSLFKGMARDALRRSSPPKDPKIIAWFGRKACEQRGYEPERGRVWFSDFVADRQGDDNGVIERIQIDATTGTATRRMLAMLEAPFGYGEPVDFQGVVEMIGDDKEIEEFQKALETALKSASAFGAMKSVGFGRVKEVKITVATAPKTISGEPGVGPILGVRWVPDRPFCFVGAKHAGNHFESFDFIPGASLKGATARLILETCGQPGSAVTPRTQTGGKYENLVKHFEGIRFGEARPASRDDDGPARPLERPLSLVVVQTEKGDKIVRDVALADGPELIQGGAPAFRIDWKESDDKLTREQFPWPDVPRERRVRTEIDKETGRAADERLFSYGMAMPDGLAWRGFIDLSAVDSADRPAVIKELTELYAFGLPNLGKTRAVAAVAWRAAPPAPQVSKRDKHVVTLQTDFLMTNPDSLQKNESLQEAYEEFWSEISNNTLKLKTFFAKQTLHGGKYLAKRFRLDGCPKTHYEPYLVTDRGSVFVLEPTGEKGEEEPESLLERWAVFGLPIPKWVEKRYGKPLWKSCPFVPQAGFGEIAVDLPIHETHSPGPAT